MNDLIRDAIDAAERVVAGEYQPVHEHVQRLLSSPGDLVLAEDSNRVYLAALLDFIGLHEEAVSIVRDAPGVMSRNMEGMLAVARGQQEKARDIFVQALHASGDLPLLRSQILANLAVVSLESGSTQAAEDWTREISDGRDDRPAVGILVAAVRTGVAARRGDLTALRDAASSWKQACRSALEELGTEHPQALPVVVSMANAEIILARADRSAVRVERAVDVLEVAAFRLAAEFGTDHLQTRAAMASLAAARVEPVPADGTVQVAETAIAEQRMPDVPDDRRQNTPWGFSIVLIAPPGAGKGTQAHFVASYLAVARISTGDIFRYNVANNTELGAKAKEYMDRGDLVPDEVTVAMVRDRLAEPDAKSGFLLDGFPRNVPQAETLKKMLGEMDQRLTVVLELVVDEEEVVRRLSGRRTCRRCERVWHEHYDPPSQPGVCGDCGGELFQRDDDKEDVIRQRLEVYNQQTAPLIAFYADEGILVGIDATGPVEEVTVRALDALQPYTR